MLLWALLAAAVLIPLLFLGFGWLHAKTPRLYCFSHDMGARDQLLPRIKLR